MSRPWPPRRHSHPLFGQDRARPHREHWQEAQQGVSDAELAQDLAELRDNPHCTALLDRIFAYSPFLTDCVVKEAAALPRLFDEGAEAWLERCLTQMRDVGALDDRAKAMSELRIARRRAALGIAVPDIADLWTADQVMLAMSQLACAAMQGALSFLLRQAALKGEIVLKHPEHPQMGCGYFLLGMGKLGAGELNFSSDIDLIALYEPAMIDYRGKRDTEDFCLRLTRDLVAMLSERTGDGYVFRTDLRLRPDPSATPLAAELRRGDELLRLDGTELGARRDDQGALRRRRPHARPLVPGRDRPLHLAQVARLPGDPGHPLDQAADQRDQGRRHDRDRGAQREARPRRHPRDRVLSRRRSS